MSRRQRDGGQHQIPNAPKNSGAPPPPPSTFIPMVGVSIPPPPPPSIGIPGNINQAAPPPPSSTAATTNPHHLRQQQNQQVQSLLKLQPFAFDFQNFDLASLGESEICLFFAQAIETIDSPFFLPSQPTHSRLVSSLIRCLSTMPWGQVFSVATIPSNLPVESSKITGVAGNKDSSSTSGRPKIPAGTFLFKLPASNRSRAYPTSMHDLHAFAKTSRRRVAALFALLAIKLANFSPSSIPDILSATLQYFNHLPPSATVSLNVWYGLPPTLSTSEVSVNASSAGGGGGGAHHHHSHHHNHNNVPSSSAPSSCRAYASALTTWLDNEIDTHIFRVLASLLSRYEEYQSQGSITRSNLMTHNNHHLGTTSDEMNNMMNDDNEFNLLGPNPNEYSGLLRVCVGVLENSVPKKRWPVMAHHLSWFSVMAKFFQSREVEFMSKSLGELEFAQNSKYSSNPVSLVFSTTVDTSTTNPAASPSSSSTATASATARHSGLVSTSNHPHSSLNNPTYSTSGPASTIQSRAQSTLCEESFSRKILQLMLNGLLNLETFARQSRENTYGARRCAAIVVDALVGVGFLKVQQDAKMKTSSNDQNEEKSGKGKNNKNNQQQQSLLLPSIQSTFASPHQRMTAGRTSSSAAAFLSNSSLFFPYSHNIESLYSVVLQHYLRNVVVMSNQSVCCSHSVVICTAIGLDYVSIPDNLLLDHQQEEGNNNNEDAAEEEQEEKEQYYSSVQALVVGCINRLAKSFSTCVNLNLFSSSSSNSNFASSPQKHSNSNHHQDSENNNNTTTRNPPTTGSLIASDIHTELLALSHLAACLKSLFTVAEQSPNFLKEEVFKKRSFSTAKGRIANGGNKQITKAFSDLVNLLLRTKNEATRNNNNNNNEPSQNQQRNYFASDEAHKNNNNAGAANWLIEEVIKPFCKTFGLTSSSLAIILKPQSVPNTPRSKAKKTPLIVQKKLETSSSDSSDSSSASSDSEDDSEDGEAAIDRFFNNRKKQQQEKQQKEEENNSFEAVRAPEVSKKIWRSYASFMKELLPFTI